MGATDIVTIITGIALQADDVAALLQRLIPDSKLAEFQGTLTKSEQQLQQQLERTATLELEDPQQQGGTPGGCAGAVQTAAAENGFVFNLMVMASTIGVAW